ncbi:hypothetical protein A3Q56_00590 [Intoshia linei]|uniref:cystathionine beta-synthase n=1 Tax=Intoshia linei TaxID=1819745 RepID=A0A177BBJ3_9BILA|nr:hypothetical protein A3Q56_00590 [Intoshia linei]
MVDIHESWSRKYKQLRRDSPFSCLPGWKIYSMIIKYGDELQQEVLAYQFMTKLQSIWKCENVPLTLSPCKVFVVTEDAGFIQPATNVLSLHELRKHIKSNQKLIDYFYWKFGDENSKKFLDAKKVFTVSCAAYCILCYLLEVKDRHNGNILLASDGRLIHIDFAYILSLSPGQNIGFELSPFKLTSEFVEVIGGMESSSFEYFKDLIVRGLMAVRKHSEDLISIIEPLQFGSNMACFNSQYNVVELLEKRFFMFKTEDQIKSLVFIELDMINWKQPPTKKIPENWTETKLENGKVIERNKSNKFIKNHIGEAIGNTPIVRINKLTKEAGIKCEILAKCEYLNPAGSIKDRIAHRMIEDAETSGSLKEGGTIIEPTSGNTGLGLAMIGAAKGYKVIVTIPEKMSNEKICVLKALNADVRRTANDAAYDDINSHVGLAWKLHDEIENSVILDQYTNVYNPLAHYHDTANEILESCDNKLDMLVLGAGTGGTLTGIGKRIKEKLPNCKIIGVDPYGSILGNKDKKEDDCTFYEVEGIGYDFIPGVCDLRIADEWVKVNDKDSFETARNIISKEGLLVGGSSGSAMWVALHMAKKYNYNESNRIVVILPDSIRNYLTKFINDDWMIKRGFIENKNV